MTPRSRRPSKQRPVDHDAADAAHRLFLAVPLPAPVQGRVADLSAALADNDWPVRWVNPTGSHLTLHFLGDTAPERAALLRLALPAVVARHPAFALRTAGLGVFPNARRPRVIWLGLHGPAHRLEALHRDLGTLLRNTGFPIDDGQFSPHVTLGRVRDDAGRELAAAIAARLDNESALADSPLPVSVAEVVLYRSILAKQGARYEIVTRCPLAAPPSDPKDAGV